ncbi:MAG: flagellar basal body rod protein FlgB [Porcipelethomonas sp.]
MYLDSIAFKAMENGIKEMSIKQQVHAQNIANIDTPDYKYKTVTFQNTLEDAMEKGKKEYSFQADVSEISETNVLIDGNNVDVDKENLELYSAYAQSSAIISKLNSAISNVRYVFTNSNFK